MLSALTDQYSLTQRLQLLSLQNIEKEKTFFIVKVDFVNDHFKSKINLGFVSLKYKKQLSS